MDYTVNKIELKDEFKVCPSCGYEDGFHSMLKKDGSRFRWLFICPACHAVFDIGYSVRMEPDKPVEGDAGVP